MSEIRAFARFLGGADANKAHSIFLSLRWMGFQTSLDGADAHFKSLDILAPEFLAIRRELPKLKQAVDIFLQAGMFSRRLHDFQRNAQTRHLINEIHPNESEFEEAVRWPIPEPLPLPILGKLHHSSAMARMQFSIALLLDRIWIPFQFNLNNHYRDSLGLLSDFLNHHNPEVVWPTENALKTVLSEDDFNRYRRSINERDLIRPEAAGDEISSPSDSSIVFYCLERQRTFFKRRSRDEGGYDSDKGHTLWLKGRKLENLLNLLQSTSIGQDLTPHFVDPNSKERLASSEEKDQDEADDEEDVVQWGSRPTYDLPERWLWLEHKSAMTIQGRRAVSSLMGWGGAKSDFRFRVLHARYTDKMLGYLLNIALSTGQLLEATGQTRIISHQQLLEESTEGVVSIGTIAFTEPKGRREYFWFPQGADSSLLNLPLVSPPMWPDDLREFRVDDFLPLPVEFLISELEDVMAKALDCRAPSARLAIRHALGRELYAVNCNSAVVRHCCGGPVTAADSKDTDSLHHYVPASSSAVRNAFLIAQRSLLNLDDESIKDQLVKLSPETSCSFIGASHIKTVISALAQEIEDAAKLSTKERHNRIAIYLATLLLIGTGHRESKALFFFHFSVSLKSLVAFLSDKQVLGSEARFIPLTQLSAEQIRIYVRHLDWLIEELKASADPLATHIAYVCGLEHAEAQSKEHAGAWLFVFEGNKLVPISTALIEREISRVTKACGLPMSVSVDAKMLRRRIATYLADQGVLGSEIQFFLGHNTALHAWGEASTQVPLNRMHALRDVIEQYLKVNGATVLTPPWLGNGRTELSPTRKMPAFQMSTLSYEGRKADADDARHSARQAILAVLGPEVLEEKGIDVINDAALEDIKSWVVDTLPADSPAREKVMATLTELVQEWRARGKVKASSVLVNLARFEPGPIEVCFGRHLAIAEHVFDTHPTVLGRYLGKSECEPIHRLAMIAFLLIVTEATLNPADLVALVNAIQAGDLVQEQGQIRIRADIQRVGLAYARTVDATDLCSAAIVGFLKVQNGEKLFEWRDVEKELNKVLMWFGRYPRLLRNWRELQLVMRPYWLLRQPGTVYACLVGKMDSTAESEWSTQSLLSQQLLEKPDHEPISVVRAKRKKDLPMGVTEAAARMTELFSKSVGVVEEKTANKYMQRRKLSQLLSCRDNPQLAAVASASSIAQIWLEFLRHLFDHGGPKADIYAHGSMASYQRRVILPVFEVAWEKDLEEFNSDDFDAFYAAVFRKIDPNKLPGARTVLTIFHQFLREYINAPKCTMIRTDGYRLRRARSIVLPKACIKNAIFQANSNTQFNKPVRDAAAGLISMGAKWGCRVKELYGLRRKDVYVDDKIVRLRRNQARGFKTRRVSPRIIPVGMHGDLFDVEIQAVYMASQSYTGYQNPNAWLFGAGSASAPLISYRDLTRLSNWALKVGSNNVNVVYHTLRHTWATGAMGELLMKAPTSPIAIRYREGLVQFDATQSSNLHPALETVAFPADRVGMWLGHSGVGTLISVYTHCIWAAASDYCFSQANDCSYTDALIAKVIALDPSTINKKRHQGPPCGTSTSLLRDLVFRYAPKYCAAIQNIEPHSEDFTVISNGNSLKLMDIEEFLLLRRGGLELEEMVQIFLDRKRITQTQGEALRSAYVKVRNRTGFPDYDPDSIRKGRKQRLGVRQGQTSRGKLLSNLTDLIATDAELRKRAILVANSWTSNVKASHPLLVVNRYEDMRLIHSWLYRIGYSSNNLVVYYTNVVPEIFHKEISSGIQVRAADAALTRHKSVIPEAEIGFDVVGISEFAVGRDFQRVLFALAICHEAGFL